MPTATTAEGLPLYRKTGYPVGFWLRSPYNASVTIRRIDGAAETQHYFWTLERAQAYITRRGWTFVKCLDSVDRFPHLRA